MNLRDAIDQDKFIIDDITYTDAELKEMSADELEKLKMLITKKISGLSAAIRGSQIEYNRGGRKTSKEWYSNVKLSLSINNRVLTYVSSLVRKRRRSISDYFMDVAQTSMPESQYLHILTIAQAKKKIGERV